MTSVIEGLAAWELGYVAAVNTYEEKADGPEREASDLRWRQAEEVVVALDAGLTQQKLADNWKRSDGTSYDRSHVSRVAKTFRTFKDCDLSHRPRWNVAYNSSEVRQASSSDSEPLEPASIPEGSYATIVADPPWQYGNSATRGAAEDHYSTMTIPELCALDVPSAENAHLYLWTTNNFLREAFEVVDAWGFDYKTCLTWVKPQIGMGNYFRSSTEHILFGLKGTLPIEDRTLRNWFEAPRGKHSAKPDSFFDLVEKASPGPYLEMFARRRRFGWDVWGDEA